LMETAILVDTGFWIALFDKRALNHSIAKDSLKPLLQNYRLRQFCSDAAKRH
jgi:predicted nucleic acid-binding protein